MVSEIFALSVSRIGDAATTVIDSFNWPTLMTTLVRTTWLFATSTPLTLDVWKPVRVTRDLVGAGADELDVVVPLCIGRRFVGILSAGVHRNHRAPGTTRPSLSVTVPTSAV